MYKSAETVLCANSQSLIYNITQEENEYDNVFNPDGSDNCLTRFLCVLIHAQCLE